MRWIVLLAGAAVTGLVIWSLPRAEHEQRTGQQPPIGINQPANAGDSHELRRDDAPDDLTLVDGPDVVLTGAVTALGRARAGAEIRVFRLLPGALFVNDTHVQSVPADEPPVARALTGGDGTFTVGFRRRSRVVAVVTAHGLAPAHLRLWMPRRGRPRPVVVDLVPGFPFRGVVSGKPREGLPVRLRILQRRRFGEVLARARTDPGGRFGWPAVAPGSYGLEVVLGPGTVYRVPITVPLHGTKRVDLPATVALTGRVADWPRARVSIETEGGAAEARTNATGSFFMAAVPTGAIQTLRVDGFDVAPPWEAIEADVARLDLDLLAGSVTGAAATHADIALIKHGDTKREIDAVRADDAGAFRFPRVAVGRYQLHAAGQVEAVEVRAGETTTVRFAAIETGRIEGRIDGVRETGYESVYVRAGTFGAHPTLDARGNFVVPHVPACTGVVARYGQQVSEPLDIVAGGVHEVLIRLPERPRVHGVVLGPDGAPRAAAYVSMGYPERNPWPHYFAASPWSGVLTDADGSFELVFHDPPAWGGPERTDWYLRVSSAGASVKVVSKLRVPTLDHPTEVQVRLAPGRELTGVVLEPGGTAAVGAAVSVSAGGYLHAAETDTEGRFSVSGIDTDSIRVRANHASGRIPRDWWDWADIEAGSTDLTLHLLPVHIVAGRVVDADGDPVPGVQVYLREEQDDSEDVWLQKIDPRLRDHYAGLLHDIGAQDVGSGFTDRDGRFRIERGVPPGEYEAVVRPTPNSETGAVRTVAGRVRAGQTDVVLRMKTGAKVSGVVVGPSGERLSRARVIGGWDNPEDWGGGMNHDQYRPVTTAGADGTFVLKGLPSGYCDLIVAAPGYLPHVFERTAAGATVELRLTKGSAIEGVVLRPDGKPFAGLDLEVKPLDKEIQSWLDRIESMGGSGWFHYTVNDDALLEGTDGAGRFRFAGLLHGRYEIRLHRSMVGTDDPIFPQTVVVSGGPAIEIRTAIAHRVEGRVVDEEGEPVTSYQGRDTMRVQVSAYQKEGDRTWTGVASWDFVDQDGRFELGGLLAGEVTLEVTAGDDYEPFEMKTAADTRGLRLVLKRKSAAAKPR